ncbi:protein PIN-LIKES 3-like isoform X2 [Lotus japonicus]|uniref:protein PIN-LIKES 3-like isoform X2 n=1 Tax=Lotus japonicus TaxID=34305 RepID=UPI00258A333F|nr:protein PIN-LIKES 3-like isoform X2 [Lotus japonicus]
MHFWNLALVAFQPVLKIFIIGAVGGFLAIDRFDILGDNAKKHLNSMVYFVFTPALICSSLAQTITFRSMVMLWFMPLNALLTYVIGIALGWLLIRTTRVPYHLQGLVLGCCSAGNLGTLPLIIVQAICKERENPFGDEDDCIRHGLEYTSITMALGHIYAWSIVYNIVRIYSPKPNVVKVDESAVNKGTDPENLSKCCAVITAEDKSQLNDYIGQLKIELKEANGEAKVPEKPNIMKQVKTLADKINLKVLFAPSSLGAIAGLLIGAVPQFQKLLVGHSAPLGVIQDSVTMLGDASLPAMILVVGAHLLKGLEGFGRQLPLVAGIIVVKLLAIPAIGVAIVKGAVHFRLIHPDPLYQFVLLLHFALPPAVSVQ